MQYKLYLSLKIILLKFYYGNYPWYHFATDTFYYVLFMLQILATDLENDLNDSNEENSAHPYVLAGSQVQKIHCRLVNVEPIIALKNLKANYYGWTLTYTHRSSRLYWELS